MEEENSIIETEDVLLGDSVYFLPSGQALTLSDTYSISASERSRYVIVMGAVGCGKTTLISSLYQQFLFPNDNNEFFFAGSQTIKSFEERSFFTRTTSYLSEPNTQRTSQGLNNNILHLRLLKREANQFINLMLIDISGEEYDNIIGDTKVAEENLSIIKFAKSIVVLIDGEKLAQIRERAAAIQRSINLIKTIYDSKLITDGAEIILAISKYDLLLKCDINSEDLFNDIVNKVSRQVPGISERLISICTAAMPNDQTVINAGFGVDNLLKQMLNNSSITNNINETYKVTSQFDLWGQRSGI